MLKKNNPGIINIRSINLQSYQSKLKLKNARYKLELAIANTFGVKLTFSLFEKLIKKYNVKYWPSTNDKEILHYSAIVRYKPTKFTTIFRKSVLKRQLDRKVFWVNNYIDNFDSVNDLSIIDIKALPSKNNQAFFKNPYKKARKKFEIELRKQKYLGEKDLLPVLHYRLGKSLRRYMSNVLSRRRCIIHFKNTNSNYFITLTDLKNNVLGSFTTGRVTPSHMKKRKVSSVLVYPIMKKVAAILKKHKVRHLALHFKSNITRHVYNCLVFLRRGYFIIDYAAFLKPIPHHFGQRKQKPRRI